MTKRTLLSGVAPSGRLTLGNYLGAILNWVSSQSSYSCYFPLVDLHAITVRQDPDTFSDICRDFVALYLACGIDPNKSVVFVQSHVPQHCELSWILQCYTQVGELNRMTQFKDKGQRHKHNVNSGLFGYPVLMAADILLYKAHMVPVGEDQRQHLELTRDIATRFNGIYGKILELPEAYIPTVGARVMSLQDPTKKMSKSDETDSNVIALLDPIDKIARKIKRCVTDSGNEIVVREDKPGVSNLLNILSAVTGHTVEALEARYEGQGYGALKADVAEAVIELIKPIQTRYQEIRSDLTELNSLLRRGSELARDRAEQTLSEVRSAIGLIPR